MKACVLHKIHDLRYEEYPDPVITDPREVIVQVLRGGICGSDMHYYEEGGIGTVIRVREPIIIGHEGIGRVAEVGRQVKSVKEGDLVVMRPARPCFECLFCKKGKYTYCEKMRHLGSAANLPHTNGLFADKVLLHEEQLRVVPGMKPEVGAFAEPLAVAYNGVRTLGELFGRKVLVMGAGPIGCLCAAAAKVLGADTVTVVDVRQAPLDVALTMGADEACNSKTDPDRIARWKEHRGAFDLMVEASGNGYALADGMAMTKPEGIVSQVGMYGSGHEPKDLGAFMTKGIQWRGVFRFYDEFGAAATALERGLIDPLPLLSASYPASQCVEAMKAALSPQTAKVQVVMREE